MSVTGLIAEPAIQIESTVPQAMPQSRSAMWWCAGTLAVSGSVGAGLLVAGDRAAEFDRSSRFSYFWLGVLIFTLPAVYWAARRTTDARLRIAVLVAYSVFTYLPKLLRNPAGPLYHDEFAHWRQSRSIVLDGRLFEANPIVRVIADFPGLHATVASFATLTGLPVWYAALVVLIGAHVLIVLGVAVLAEEIWGDRRIAAVAAIIYTLNSSFLFFDTQFGYESLALPLLVWTLIALLRAMRAAETPTRAGWSAVTLLLAFATIATHHLTALGLIATMMILSTVAWIQSARTRTAATAAWTAWSLTAAGAAVVAAWLIWVAPRTAGYLDPYLGRALDQIAGMAGGAANGRTLFSDSVAPWWEQDAAFIAPVGAFVAMAAAAVWMRRRRLGDPVARGAALSLFLLGLLYFPAALLILTPSGAEGARRSWAFSYLGIAVVVAPVVVRLLDRAGRLTRRRVNVLTGVGLIAVCTVMLIGNTAAGMNPSYRFPGPSKFGSDTRSATPEVMAAATWLRKTHGRGLRIVADRYSGLIFGSYGESDPVTGSVTFPTYDLYLGKPGQVPSPALIEQLRLWDFSYLIVDRRMARQIPDIKIYFETNEPIAHNDTPAFTIEQLTKFDSLPWTVKVYDSGDIAIYRFDFGSLAAPTTDPIGSAK